MTSTSIDAAGRLDGAPAPRAERPRIHFTAESGWINDPHGITVHDGRYHLFHQYVPGSAVWQPTCHWGHAVGTDLLHWERRPIALAPGDGDGGIWTGSLVDAEDGARILYTSTIAEDYALGRIRVARPTDPSWDVWEKGDVLLRPPADLDLVVFRDPFVLREEAGWRMFVGAGTSSGDALAITYTSADLDSWQYDGVAARRSTSEREPVWTGALWECPQIVEIDCRHVLISSVWDADVLHYAAYGIGEYRDGRFEARDWGRLSFGDSYYAPSFFRDAEGRPCLMFWMRGVEDAEAGWTGALSVPHLLGIRDDRLVVLPHPAWASAPGAPVDLEDLTGAPVLIGWTPEGAGDRLELGAATALVWDGAAVALERSGAETSSAPHRGGRLEVLLDGPVLEVVTSAGVLGGPIAPATSARAVGGRAEARALA
ncbi:glycoside hydrolase family 32 protein [Rathayibacter sp. VKM Ac-2754]|uniref:glycoside hydrolase family 32 protein n=1 Tax=Rathayibacter sp. VKM Ac-2754 TaxID=2609251 RepID=UPI00135C1C4C|nr:glycoside hydrolase family 32 protein [Rathayibacter sp. VKM Ac-2754]MWV60681.1 glycoside hydrolase family 32 protein [Rathayibacter sp. VKM Ac-2754]